MNHKIIYYTKQVIFHLNIFPENNYFDHTKFKQIPHSILIIDKNRICIIVLYSTNL